MSTLTSINLIVNNSDDEEASEFLAKTTEFLWRLAGKTRSLNSGLSSFYANCMQNIVNGSEKIELGPLKVTNMINCPYCGAFWSPKTTRIRCQPRPPLTKRLKRLHKLNQLKPMLMTTKNKKLILKFKKSRNKFVLSCLQCGKSTKIEGNKKHAEPTLLPKETVKAAFNLKATKQSNQSRRTKRNQKRTQCSKVLDQSPSATKHDNYNLKTKKAQYAPPNLKNGLTPPVPPKRKKKNALKQILEMEINESNNPRSKGLVDFLESLQ